MRETNSNVIARNVVTGRTPGFASDTPLSLRTRPEQGRETQVDLRRPFEEVVSSVLSLPWGRADLENLVTEAELLAFLRGVHEAANGRQVETAIGFIPIAPPVAEFLRAKPYHVSSRIGFLVEVATRILCGPDNSTDEEVNSSHLK
jgi:hypothetical protein